MSGMSASLRHMKCTLRLSSSLRRHSTGSLPCLTVIPFERRLSQFHSAAHGSPVPTEDALPGTLHGKLEQLRDASPVQLKSQRNWVDSVASVAGWTVVALGLGISLHGSRSMMSGEKEKRRRLEESLRKLPEVEISPDALFAEQRDV